MKKRLIWLVAAGTMAVHGQVTCPLAGAMKHLSGSIGGIADGARLTATASWYELTTNTVRVPVLQPVGDCMVRIQGMTPVLDGAQWVVRVPMGYSSLWPLATTVYQGKRFAEIPFISALVDPHRVNKPLVYELVDKGTGTVLARQKIVILDVREDSTFRSRTGVLTGGAGVELTQTGADKLEQVHRTSLPQPDLAAFNASLTTRFQGVSLSLAPDTAYASSGKSCIALSNADADFLNTSAYASAVGLSAIAYQSWNQADTICQTVPNPLCVSCLAAQATACAVAASNCVRDQTPSAGNFELCTGRVSGTSKTLTLAGVNEVDLSITNGAPLNSTISLGRLDGAVDGTLSESFIRWSDSHAGCVLRPTAPLSVTDEQRSAIAAWRACAGLEVDAQWAKSKGIAHQLPGISERIEAAAAATLPLFLLDPSHPRNPDQGSCSAFRTAVLSLLDLYYPSVQTALDGAWLAPTQHAAAMDDLTSVWETGINETMADVDLVMSPKTPTQLSGNRMSFHLDTAVNTRPGAPSASIYSEPMVFPCFEPPPGSPAEIPCHAGRNIYGREFDTSYTVTTPAINQVLADRQPGLRITPTFEDLQQPVPPGRVGTDPWEVDGTWLSALFPALSDLGTTKLKMRMEPQQLAFTYMSRDPRYYFEKGAPAYGAVKLGRTPLTYQMAQYAVKLVGDQPGPDGTDVWAEFLLDLYDPNFGLALSTQTSRPELIPAYGSPVRLFTMVKNQFSQCPAAALGEPAKCGELLASLVAQAVAPKFEAMLLGAINGYPAPLLFDARGKASESRTLVESDRFFQGQVMTFYGKLR